MIVDKLRVAISGHSSSHPTPAASSHDAGHLKDKVITVSLQSDAVANTMSRITNAMLAAGTSFNRADQLAVVNGKGTAPILSSIEPVGLLNHYVEFYLLGEESGEYKPLPPSYDNTWPNHPSERARLPVIKLFSKTPVFTEDWRLLPPS